MRTVRLNVVRRPQKFTSDARRVITRLFLPGDETRLRAVLDRVLGLDELEASRLLDEVYQDFESRHYDLASAFRAHYEEVAKYIDDEDALSEERRLLIGAYFTKEYSFESAALFNPSIVPHPDQSGLPPGALRFLMSLRATGEGHVSSIVFRAGVIGASGKIIIAPPSPYARSPEPLRDYPYEKRTVFLKLIEMGAYNNTAGNILDRLSEHFNQEDLDRVLDELGRSPRRPENFEESARDLRWLARSNYVLELPANGCPSEIVIFPVTADESRGMEDMRLTRFVDDDGEVCYYGIYTAYNGFRILPQLLKTENFHYVQVTPLHGKYVQNKGQALFPRKVDGWYTMISRLDGENLYLMRSKNIRFWNEAKRLQIPTYPWEFMQIGNCGPPLETPEGWLLLTHGVGPMREYCIGATLLDLDDPSRVIGQTKEPLLAPNEDERDGYVPNVVYSCGSLIHREQLIIPYAISDSATCLATVPLFDLLNHLAGQKGDVTRG